MPPAAPRVFISYSHDSGRHVDWVTSLASDLRLNGVDAILDRWEIGPGHDLAAFMEEAVTTADRVIVVCTPKYVAKANAGEGGVGYEKMIVTAELVKNLGTTKFIPLLRDSGGEKQVPTFLGSRVYVDFDDDAAYKAKLTELLRALHERPASKKPAIGRSPFLHQPEAGPAPTPVSASAERPIQGAIDREWVERERAAALVEFSNVGMRGSVEISFALEPPKLAKGQAELIEAARASVVHTFGWPIAVMLENRPEYRPRARKDGVISNVGIKDRPSFDYWVLRTNGDFYLLMSLFEDQRAAEDGRFRDKLFFDTRIVRMTEAVLYCKRLYSALGVGADARVQFETRYTGLRGRALIAASARRVLFEGRASEEDEVSVGATFTLRDVDENPVIIVRSLLAPLFILFDFFELSDEVYADIVNKFVNGQIG